MLNKLEQEADTHETRYMFPYKEAAALEASDSSSGNDSFTTVVQASLATSSLNQVISQVANMTL